MLFEVPKIRWGVVKKDAECEIGIQKLRFSRFPALPIGRNYITSLPLEMSLDRLRQSYGTKSISKTITASYSGPNVSILSYDIFTNTERSSCYSRPCIAKAYRMCLTETEYSSSLSKLLVTSSTYLQSPRHSKLWRLFLMYDQLEKYHWRRMPLRNNHQGNYKVFGFTVQWLSHFGFGI